MMREEYMRIAIELARKGEGYVSPNPLVGAVIVKKGKIIGEGFHEKYGEAHAERNALLNCRESPKGAVMYVTLEPCCHQGKQPPCTEAIVEAGIQKVVIGSRDPNPLVAGNGIKQLKESGIEVEEGVLEEECKEMNKVFFHYIQKKRPYVIMKYAMTIDGKIATVSGRSKWITGEKAREHVHRQRHLRSAIMVGSGTVLTDNPMLDCRIEGGKNPIRIICDSTLRIPADSRIVITAKEIPTYIATAVEKRERWKEYEEAGCKVIFVPGPEGKVELNHLLTQLGEEGIDSLILEGGETLNGSFLLENLVDAVQVYISPQMFGGKGAKTPIGGAGILEPSDSARLKINRITLLGEDLLVEGEVKNHVYGNCGRSRSD